MFSLSSTIRRSFAAHLLLLPWLAAGARAAEPAEIPAALSTVSRDAAGHLLLSKGGELLPALEKTDRFALAQMLGDPQGAATGIALDFHDPKLTGVVAYGPYDEAADLPTVAFLAKSARLEGGQALLECKSTFTGSNDFFKLERSGRGILGFRVSDAEGRIIYEGRVAFEGHGPYRVVPTLIEGPLVNVLTPSGCVLSFETQVPLVSTVTVGGRTFRDPAPVTRHELQIDGLQPATLYPYTIAYGAREARRSFRTAPLPGSRHPFTFAFASANRATTGGGERDFGGTNYASTRAIMAAALLNHAVFLQATGDITNGENPSAPGHLLEYADWKRALEPFWAKVPVYVGFGDHEDDLTTFAPGKNARKSVKIDRFPYASESGEAVFAQAFVHPLNGPPPENAAAYGLDPRRDNFPPYRENVYYYTYDNVAMIVLNTEYWKGEDPQVSGSPEGYIMDGQYAWLETTVRQLEKNPNIDHIFVNLHSAVFPNGDHANGAMWYDGGNWARPKVKGVPVGAGILERRDQILDLCVNRSRKFVGFLSGDEHNFAFLEVTPDTPLYPADYRGPKIRLGRTIYHINNGTGGSASYAMLATPWDSQWRYFTAPPAVALIEVSGPTVSLRAFRAETFEPICAAVRLR